jgi:TonB family protein
MEYLLKLPLLTKTFILSLIAHIIIISLIPGFIGNARSELTARDIKFFIDNILSDEKVSLGNPLPNKQTEPSLLKPDTASPFPKYEIPQPLNSGTNNYGWVNNTPTAPADTSYTTRDTNKNPSIKPKTTKLSAIEAQKILQQLENELSLKEISDQRDKNRSNSFKYLDIFREQIKAQYFIPNEAKWQKMKGLVLIQVTVSTRGDIKDISFVTHSDFPILDMAARGTIERAAPFPNIENSLDLKELKFIVPIRY